MQKVKKIGTVLASILLWAIILVASLFTFTTLATRDNNHVASIAGFTPMTVQSDSMAPVFYAGDMIVVKSCDPDTLVVGDIITFHTIIQNEYVLNTHRIAEIEETNGYRSYVTKGDNNLVSDTHIIANADIVGKYQFKIAKMGKFMDFLASSTGFLIVIVLPLLVFFIYQVYHLIMISIKVKRANALETAQAQAEILAAANQKSDEENERVKAEAEQAKAEAAAVLEEAKRLRAEAEAKLAEAGKTEEKAEEPAEEATEEKAEESAEEATEEKAEESAEETAEEKTEESAEEAIEEKNEDQPQA